MRDYEAVVAFHGHSCPGLAMGYRVAAAAMTAMHLTEISEDEEFLAIVENDSCAVDAIQVVTGCTFGKGNLLLRDYGKQSYTFVRRSDSKAVRICVDYLPPKETAEDTEMWRRYSAGDKSAEVLAVIRARKAKKVQFVLAVPQPELLKITDVVVAIPPEARIYPSIRCEACHEKMAEAKARVKDGKIVCIPCSATVT